MTLGVCVLTLARMHTRTNPHTSDWALAKHETAFKLRGFIVQSHEILFHAANKWIRQARKMSGLKNKHGNTETSFDKSCLCL